jgi:hypothetical protein
MGGDHEPPPVDGIGHGAAEERHEQDRQEAKEAEEPQAHGRMGEKVQLPSDGDLGDLAAGLGEAEA